MPLALALRDPLSASNAHCSAIYHKKGSPNVRSQKDDLETGLVGGLAYSNGNQERMTLSTKVSVRFDQNASFVAGTASDSTTFSGNLIGTDDVTGNWMFTADNGSESFEGSRVGGAADSAGRFSGEFLGDATSDGDGTPIGTLDRVAGSLSGTWSNSGGDVGTFAGSGCQLN